MEGLGRAGEVSPNRDGESLVLPIHSEKVQIALMLYAYARAHKERTDIIPAHIEQIDRNPDALREWVENDASGTSLAQSFRTYVEKDPDKNKSINIGKDEALEEILAAVTHTVH